MLQPCFVTDRNDPLFSLVIPPNEYLGIYTECVTNLDFRVFFFLPYTDIQLFIFINLTNIFINI